MAADVSNILNDIAETSQRIKSKEPPIVTSKQKQAAEIMATLEKEILALIMEGMPLKIIFSSLFYFWIILEAPLHGVKTEALDNWRMPLEKAVESIVDVIETTLKSLPDYQPTADMEKLGTNVNAIKSLIPDDETDQKLSPEEVTKQVTTINKRIHTTTANFFRRSFHPEIVANVLFGYWLRISTMSSYVPENYYQKMEYYFDDIKKAVRKHVPTLF